MTIKLIIAVDQSNAIGWSDGRLAHTGLKHDMQRFKQLTTNSMVVMGRSTYLSLGRPNGLPNRRNVVLTRRPYSEVRGQFGDVEIISSLDWVVQHNEAAHRTVAGTDREPADIWIIGGKSVYEEALKMGIVDEIYLTVVHTTSEADVVMDTDIAAWKHFILKQRAIGTNWEAQPVSRQSDGNLETSYMHLRKL